jgi:hypothetical protein
VCKPLRAGIPIPSSASRIAWAQRIPCSRDLAPAVLGEDGANRGVVLCEQRRPLVVAELPGQVRRPDDVGEEDGCERLLGLRCLAKSGQEIPYLNDDLVSDVEPGHVILARQLDEAGPLDLLRQPASLFVGDDRILGSVEDERRDVDRRRHVANVDLAPEPHEGNGGRGGR